MKTTVQHPGDRRPRGRRRNVAQWSAVAVLLVLFVGALAGAATASAWAVPLLLAGSFGMLGLAGWPWGEDSRDGADWRPRRPGAIR